ncbi:MAG: metallophosphoesterase [Roseburia sp.]
MRRNISGRIIITVFTALVIMMISHPMTVQAAQWKQDSHGWRYRLDSGSYAQNGWQYINGTWYFFNSNRYMETGWLQHNGIWYYLNSSGAMETGWLNDNGTWYYLDSSGAMETGWLNDNGTWYYLDSSGAMATGWLKDGETWYYLDDSGAMVTGWLDDNGTWYYLDDSGAMVTGWLDDNGTWYYLNDSGDMVTGWLYDDEIWYYMYPDGSMETDFVDVTGQYAQLGLKFEKVTLQIPGLQQDYDFLWLSDLHIIAGTEDIAPEDMDTVEERINAFQTSTGVQSAQLWEELPAVLDNYHADAIFFGGDMIDHASEENIACLQQGLAQLQTPYIYVRADHDMKPWYCEEPDSVPVEEKQAQIDGNPVVSCLEYEDLCVVGINNSTSQLSSEALNQVESIYDKGKPMIVVTHVPLDSQVDTTLSQQSKQVWQGRNLTWGSGAAYEPDAVTQEFLDMVYEEDTHIKAVLCGHMHFSWDGQLTESTREHVFSPAAGGTIGVIHVTDGD